eukprot:6432193-Pyramimonas_sp.AAC.1
MLPPHFRGAAARRSLRKRACVDLAATRLEIRQTWEAADGFPAMDQQGPICRLPDASRAHRPRHWEPK